MKNTFYKLARFFGKLASTTNDVETLMTLDPKKISKRFIRKKISKTGNKTIQKINKKLK